MRVSIISFIIASTRVLDRRSRPQARSAAGVGPGTPPGELRSEVGNGMQRREVSAARAARYMPDVLRAVPRLLHELDREPRSLSYGRFDRQHWGWKFRDHPLGMLQTAAYPLALLWRFPLPDNPYHRSERLLGWIEGAFEETLERQHRSGAFSAFVPYEQDPMSTLGMAHGLSEAYLIVREALAPPLGRRFLASLGRAADFALHRDEDHAFVSNHWALFAVAFRTAYDLLGDERYRRRSEQVLDRIFSHQSPDGWYHEYGGPDPGYESLGIFHLATYWRRTGAVEVLDSLRRSVEFYAHCVHPDGSVGGGYGSRHTSLYVPAGFEVLASEIPLAASVAAFMAERLTRHNVVIPSIADVPNLPPLAYGFLEAALVPGDPPPDGLPALPCESDDTRRRFDDSGVSVVGTRRYYAVLNAGKGGVCRVFDRVGDRIAYEDAGYLVTQGRRRWTSQLTGLASPEQGKPGERPARGSLDGDDVVCAARLAEARQILPTPAKLLLLRALNLTLFRSPRIGHWIRKRITARLITDRRLGPFQLRRRVRFGPDEIRFEDRLEALGPSRVEAVALPRSFTGIHMGSAKYFHPSDLTDTPLPPVGHMAAALNGHGVAECAFALRFSGEGVELDRLDPPDGIREGNGDRSVADPR